MDKVTKTYRKAQLKKLLPVNAEYKPTIQLCSESGKTFWLSLDRDEFEAIVKILTK